jgi:hypothetical protein
VPATNAWGKAFPYAAAAAGLGDPTVLERAERDTLRSLQTQQLLVRLEALRSQLFTLENQAITFQDTLLRKLSQAEDERLSKERQRQLQHEISVLRDRLEQGDERITRLLNEIAAVSAQVSESPGHDLDAPPSSSTAAPEKSARDPQSSRREFVLPGGLLALEADGRVVFQGAVPAMRVVTTDIGGLHLIGDTEAIDRYLRRNGIREIEIDDAGVHVDAARAARVRSFLGLPAERQGSEPSPSPQAARSSPPPNVQRIPGTRLDAADSKSPGSDVAETAGSEPSASQAPKRNLWRAGTTHQPQTSGDASAVTPLRQHTYEVELTDDQLELVEELARRRGIDKEALLSRLAVEAAENVLRERSDAAASAKQEEEDERAFKRSLDPPGPPRAKRASKKGGR